MKLTIEQINQKISEIKQVGSGYPYGFITWFGNLAAVGRNLGYFKYDGPHIFYAIQHLDAEAWKDLFMAGYSPKEAILEDMSNG